jgi:hypothetical protein
LGKCDVEAIWAPPKALFEAMLEEKLAEDAVEFERLVLAAVSELVGPYNCAADEPPATKPVDPVVLPWLVRMKRVRRSSGLFIKEGSTSRTTWYWFNCV